MLDNENIGVFKRQIIEHPYLYHQR